jgi:hypothetical protein
LRNRYSIGFDFFTLPSKRRATPLRARFAKAPNAFEEEEEEEAREKKKCQF